MSDYVDKLPQDANEIRVIRACHTCQHREGYGQPYEEQWCLAAGTNLDEARAEGKCGLNLDWWKPIITEANSHDPTAYAAEAACWRGLRMRLFG
jgi:hypothetical protein